MLVITRGCCLVRTATHWLRFHQDPPSQNIMVCSGWIAMNFGPRSQDISADHADFLGTFCGKWRFFTWAHNLENLWKSWISVISVTISCLISCLDQLPWFISSALRFCETPMPTFGPLGDGTDAEKRWTHQWRMASSLGSTLASTLNRWNPGSKLSKPCIKVGTTMPLKPLKHT